LKLTGRNFITGDAQEENAFLLILRQDEDPITGNTEESKCRIIWHRFQGRGNTSKNTITGLDFAFVGLIEQDEFKLAFFVGHFEIDFTLGKTLLRCHGKTQDGHFTHG